MDYLSDGAEFVVREMVEHGRGARLESDCVGKKFRWTVGAFCVECQGRHGVAHPADGCECFFRELGDDGGSARVVADCYRREYRWAAGIERAGCRRICCACVAVCG